MIWLVISFKKDFIIKNGWAAGLSKTILPTSLKVQFLRKLVVIYHKHLEILYNILLKSYFKCSVFISKLSNHFSKKLYTSSI